MPKGQEKTKKLPEDLDPAAVLSLFKYCKWFKRQVPNSASIVSDLIEIRNEIFHSGDFRVEDNKKDICIDNITQLLTELGINGNVVSELQKLKCEDIDINYRETELKAINTILTAVKGMVDSLCADQIQLSDYINIAQTDISSLQAMQLQQGQEMQEMKDKTKQTKEKLVTVETDIKDIKMELEQEREILEKMRSFLSSNSDIDDMKILTENMQEIEIIVTDLQPKLDKAEKDISELQSTILSMERRISSVEKRQDVLENREDVLENRQDVLESRQDVLEKNFAERAEVDGKNQSCLKNDVKFLRVELVSRYRPIRTIPISFVDEEEMCSLEALYTDTVINCKVEEKNNRLKDQTAVSCKPSFKGRQRIILTGPSGSGKSTYCRKIVDRWCNLQEDKKTDANAEGRGTSTHDSLHVRDPWTSNTSTTDSSFTIADEDLNKYELVFYINSPAILNERTLIEVLCNQCLKRELDGDKDEIEKKVSNILIRQPEKILMIFDGLDELGHPPDFVVELLKGSLYPEITVLMVMRPWHISRLGLKSIDPFVLHLEINGFSRDNALRFVHKVFYISNSKFEKTKDINISSKAEEIILYFKNVPLCLLFFAHILYNDQSLLHKRKDLHNKIIDGLIERWLKKTGNKHIECNLDHENVHSNTFCEDCRNSAYKVAYDFLLKRKDDVSGVIPQKELIQELGDDADGKLIALLDWGIMSKVDIFSPLEKTVYVTFLHKSVQEYLASFHLVKNEEVFQAFLQSIKTLNDVNKHENVIIFICGLDADHGHKAFNRICEVCDVDPYVQKYRHGEEEDDDDGYSYFKVKGDIESLNKMYKACIDEMDKEEPLQIPDIIAQNDIWFKLVISRQSSHDVRSLTLFRFSVIQCMPELSSLRHLTSLTLRHLSLSEEQSRSLCSCVNSLTQLQKLELVCIDLTDCVIDLSNLQDLTFLKLNINDRAKFIKLSACTKLEKLELAGITLDDGVLDFKKLTGLTHIMLSSLIKSKECTISLCNSFSACTKLKKLVLSSTALYDGTLDSNAWTNLTFLSLDYISVSDGSSRSFCSNISQLTCLKTLELMNTNLWDGILDLKTLTHLTHLTLVVVKMSKKCSRSLCNCIRSGNIAHMKSLHLDDIVLYDGVLDLTTLTSLTDLELKKLTMCDKCAESLCSSLSACTKLEKLCLYGITMAKECTRSLSNNISACTNLTLLWLENISLHDTELELKNLRDLCILLLSNVTMSDECIKILKESIKHCRKLRSSVINPDRDN